MIKNFFLVSLNISQKTGTIKYPVEKITLVKDMGVLDDAHLGKMKDRQVSFLAIEDIERFNCENKNIKLKPGSFAENITTKGIELYSLKLGTKLYIGEAILEISKIGKTCHNSCEIKNITGECIMPKRGIFASVIKGGKITLEDTCYYHI